MKEDIRKMITKIKNLGNVINENENLDILYHGSKYLFNKFDLNKINLLF